MLPYIAIAIIAYFIGSINFAVILSRKYAGVDIRDKGSKGARSYKCFKNCSEEGLH